MLGMAEKERSNSGFKGYALQTFGWVDNEHVKSRVQYEARRGLKNGYALSFVRFKLTNRTAGRRLCRLITRNTRKYDLKFTIDNWNMGVVLLETPLKGAVVYRDRMKAVVEAAGMTGDVVIYVYAFEDMVDKIMKMDE